MAAPTTTTTTTTTTATDSPRNGLPSPWAQVVKGAGDLPESSESNSREDIPANEGNAGKKPVWNKPANAVSPPPPSPPPDQAVVMGAASWPALSESTRLPLKSSDSPKSTPEVSLGPTTSNPQPPKQASANTHQNSSMNNAVPTRQRPIKRGGGGGGGGGNRQGGFVRETPLPVSETAQSNFSRAAPLAGSDSSSRETRPIGGFASHPNSSNDHFNHRSSNRRGNFGRGNGRNNYHGGRRDQDHGNQDWSSPASPHGRGAHGHHHRPQGRGLMGPAVQGPPAFVSPSPMRPYPNAVMYPDPGFFYYYQPFPADAFRGMTYVPGPPPPPYPVPHTPDPLRVSVVNQIEYYFSDANLVKDQFLRSKMDEQGWVPITLIASFPRVQNLSDNIPFILGCLSTSSTVEVQGDKLRRRDGWMKWIPHQQSPSRSSSQSPDASDDNLSTAIREMSLGETSASALNEEADNLPASNLECSVQRVC